MYKFLFTALNFIFSTKIIYIINRVNVLIALVFLTINLCFSQKKISNKNIYIEEKIYLDTNRNRKIPVTLYSISKTNNQLIVFSHGYKGNTGLGNNDYTYLFNYLALRGYLVASVQHELKSDIPLCMDGILINTRMPDWEKGVNNIFFVLENLRKEKLHIDFGKTILIGHSNGGDMTMLFATKYPELIQKAISMDNRRYPLPRTASPRIYSIRSNDYEADAGVLPTPKELKDWRITIDFSNINHNNMDDNASKKERKEILRLVGKYLVD